MSNEFYFFSFLQSSSILVVGGRKNEQALYNKRVIIRDYHHCIQNYVICIDISYKAFIFH